MKKKPYVKPETKSNDLEELKRFMDYSVSVEHWNEKREIGISFSETEKQIAKDSKKDFGNCPAFRELFNAWIDGSYDNDIEILEQKVKALLK